MLFGTTRQNPDFVEKAVKLFKAKLADTSEIFHGNLKHLIYKADINGYPLYMFFAGYSDSAALSVIEWEYAYKQYDPLPIAQFTSCFASQSALNLQIGELITPNFVGISGQEEIYKPHSKLMNILHDSNNEIIENYGGALSLAPGEILKNTKENSAWMAWHRAWVDFTKGKRPDSNSWYYGDYEIGYFAQACKIAKLPWVSLGYVRDTYNEEGYQTFKNKEHSDQTYDQLLCVSKNFFNTITKYEMETNVCYECGKPINKLFCYECEKCEDAICNICGACGCKR